MTLKFYNTRTRSKDVFQPLDPAKPVRMYVCGPTVYNFAHIGNARPIIVFDVLFRLLRLVYGVQNVVYARNITDVDDKINARAKQEGISIGELTQKTTAQFHADMDALGCLSPTVEPRATDHIGEMIALNEQLIARGHAYVAQGHVLFDVQSDADYGKFARRSLDEMRAGARVEVAPYKRDAMDFVLWKPSAEGEPGWDSPWGRGRPGWHLECSAMSAKYLGEVFDIHGGGIDLVFPHHENEVAQSTCGQGTSIMANFWMHNGHLQAEGEKMSKSLGNFIIVRDLLEKWPPEVVRLTMLSTHYRQPMDWTEEKMSQARQALLKFSRQLQKHNLAPFGRTLTLDDVPPKVLDALADDLNTAAAITVLHELEAALQITGQGAAGDELATKFDSALELMGLSNIAGFEDRLSFDLDTARIDELLAARLAARGAKNWAEADRIRDELIAMGIVLKDAKDPATGQIVTTWEVAK